jgi:hypothetical protein
MENGMRHLVTLGLLVASLVTAPPALAAAAGNPMAAFVKSCETQMYMSASQCACMADRAAKELDAQAIAYLSLPALDVAHSTAMSKSMSAAERVKIDHFMATAPHQCGAP